MSQTDKPFRNRLADETSPYLRQHAHNPVDWYPWGPEALERARRENKPILLSVGYSACHWCHVMAHESFENEGIAKVMNERFVNIKVDREERPDVDQLYQGVVQLMRKGGGWPLTVFLTPDLRPFFGGTYFPSEDKYGMPSFPRILLAVHEAFTQRPDEVEAQAQQFKDGLAFLGSYGLDAAAPGALNGADVVRAAELLETEIDRRHGGFGDAPKFPNPMNVALLLRGHRRGGNEKLSSGALLSLEKMARGGVYDQLGGGFHRYSVDERWLVPHFEKMLYDNAQLLHLYAEAEQVSPNPLWRKVAEETVAYLVREMTDAGGGFYAAQDADSEGEEGKFFVWSDAEVNALLTAEEAAVVKRVFGITPEGNFEGHTNVLEIRTEVEVVAAAMGRPANDVDALLRSARQKLFDAREKRVKPGRDDKVLTGWNGLAIRGLAYASRAFGRPEWAAHAARAADFVLGQMWRDGSLLRSYKDGQARIDGFIEDYGDLAAGLVALFQATFEPRYLEAAEKIADAAVARFWDDARQAYLTAPRGQSDLLVPTYALHDNAYPSGASSLTEAHVALAALTGRTRHLEQAGRYLGRLREQMLKNPFAFGHLWLAADAFVDGAAEVTIVGARDEAASWLEQLGRAYLPTVAVLAHDPDAPTPEVLREGLHGRDRVAGKTAAYLCRNFACERPVTEPATLLHRMGELARPGAAPDSRPT